MCAVFQLIDITMPSLNVTSEETPSAPATKPAIGIIYPPPEVRNIVDKTASFVARNGPEFETRIRQNEINNPKFNFLTFNDPYHAYYRHKVKEFQEGRGQEPSAVLKSGFGFLPQKPAFAEHLKSAVEAQVPLEPPAEFEFIADPPSISAFDLDMVKLTAQFVARNGRQFLTNLMKIEARNYQFDFLRPQHSLFNYFTKLVEQYTKILIPPKDLLGKLRKEADNYHVILDEVKHRMEWARHQERERKREEEEKEKERVSYAQVDWHDFVVVETVEYLPSEAGNLPPPTTPDEVGARMLQQQRYDEGVTDEDAGNAEDDVEPEDEVLSGAEEPDEEEEEEEEEEFDEEDKVVTRSAAVPAIQLPLAPPQHPPQHPPQLAPQPPPQPPGTMVGADTQVQDMEEDSESESEGEDEDKLEKRNDVAAPSMIVPPPPPPPVPKDVGPKLPPLPPNPENVIIRKDYDPKAPKVVEQVAGKFLVSPITGEQIPAEKIQEHMRIGLLDPKWIEQRDRALAERREQEEVYAQGSAISDQLKDLAARRTDIFGSGAEETQIGKKIGEEDKKEKTKVIWDGHSASMEKVSQKARENITIEDQIAVIHKVQGLVSDEEKEKIGPAMPKTAPPEPVPQPKGTAGLTNVHTPSVPAPPPPPTTATTASTSTPRGLPPLPMSKPPLPPVQPPPPAAPPKLPVGNILPVPVPPGMMMMAQPGPPGQGVLGPRPPLAVPPVVRAPFMPGIPMPPVMQPVIPPPVKPAPPAAPMRPPTDMSSTDDEPPTKRSKTEDQLITEGEFLMQHKGPVTFQVQVPSLLDKSEWKLGGQSLTVTLPLTDTVSVIKAKVFDELGMPAGKQKLQLDGMFMKDSNTLAFYNFTPMCVVQLQVKERGGRKK